MRSVKTDSTRDSCPPSEKRRSTCDPCGDAGSGNWGFRAWSEGTRILPLLPTAMSNPFPSVQDFKESLEVLSEDLDEGGMTTYLTGILKAVQSNGKEGPWKEVLKAYCVSPFRRGGNCD